VTGSLGIKDDLINAWRSLGGRSRGWWIGILSEAGSPMIFHGLFLP
jgi:hypothetical protein